MAKPPLAMFITWTCYGTWMPGDRRGFISNRVTEDGAFTPTENRRGTAFPREDAATLEAARKAQRHRTVRLTAQDALTALQAIERAARERHWFIIRAAAMPDHVHTLTRDCPADGPAIRRIYKGCSSARLSSARGEPGRWWTHGGSDRYLNDPGAVDAVENYIRTQQCILCEITHMQIVAHG